MKVPALIPVKSSNIEAVRHGGNALHVKFRDGATYVYDGVGEELYNEFVSSDSLGKFLAANIRGKFPHRRLPDAEPNA